MPRAFHVALAAIAAGVSVAFPRVASTAPGPDMNDEKAGTGPAQESNQLRSSTYDCNKQRLGLTEASARPVADCQKAVAKQDVAQEVALQMAGTKESQPGVTSAEVAKLLGPPCAAHTLSKPSCTVSASGTPNAEASGPGSTVAERMRFALQLVGERPLEDVAKTDPKDALRAYIIQNRKPYNDESPEFAEKLRIFTRNCEIIRESNAQKIAMGHKPTLGVNYLADTIMADTWKGGESMHAWIEPGGWLYERHGIRARCAQTTTSSCGGDMHSNVPLL